MATLANARAPAACPVLSSSTFLELTRLSPPPSFVSHMLCGTVQLVLVNRCTVSIVDCKAFVVEERTHTWRWACAPASK